MNITPIFPLLEDILQSYQDILGVDYPGYHNHCCRVIHFCQFLHGPSQ